MKLPAPKIVSAMELIGLSKPPKKKNEPTTQYRNIAAYSSMKKKDQRMPEYSVMNPATSSDSASGRSKGARFVSARIEMKNRRKAGSMKGLTHGQMYQLKMPNPPLCPCDTSMRLKEPATMIGTSRLTPSGIS